MMPPSGWPLREHSLHLRVDGLDWHLQRLGRGPILLLLHGTGASCHSFAPLARLLAKNFELLIPDLPGQGFSGSLPASETTLEGFAQRVAGLLAALDVAPVMAVGHSAGAAVLAQLVLQGLAAPRSLVSLNGAFLPFGSVAAPVFSRAASVLSRSRLLAWITAAHGLFERPVRNLIEETGSNPTPEMLYCYQILLRRPDHIAGTLRMMAGWRLEPLKQALPSLPVPLHLVTCLNDRTVEPWQSQRLAELVHRATLHEIPELGHLGHEEQPARFAPLVASAYREIADS
jgi:magnesium chelatase accessory protein